jgi:ribosomal protein S18 acetylase RimI-like enzyme
LLVVHFRPFRNDDSPALAEIWNEAFVERGAVILRHSSPLERYVFSKPYFDPAGLIVALEDQKRVGFGHAGFGPKDDQTALCFETGVTCLIGVRTAYRRVGIGSELLACCENYLRQRGARTLHAGAMRPLDPFYFGLYGGSDLTGFLASDRDARPFLEARGYVPGEGRVVLQRQLDKPLQIVDARFATLRRHFQIRAAPGCSIGTWWRECVLGTIETLEFALEDCQSARAVARAELWEMEGFSWRWGLPSVGLLNLQVEESRRRQGFAKFLLSGIIHYLQEQYYGLIEFQIANGDQPALGLCLGLGFEQVDAGLTYRRLPSQNPPSTP